MSVYLLRTIRDIRSMLPKDLSSQSFGLSLVPNLHGRLAESVSGASLEEFGGRMIRKKVAGRALWEGDPELPVQPSPSTFKFLHSLLLDMGRAGADLWSPTAIRVLKRHLRTELGRRWAAALKKQEEKYSSQVNGNATNGEVDAEHEESTKIIQHGDTREILTQTLFDVLVLQSALDSSELASEDELKALEGTLHSTLDLSPGLRKRLEQAAKEYWKRTSLLFGLL
jgi:hypothetical protein